MPAIVDPEGSGCKPISIFESGAIPQYLGNKTGKFYPKRTRDRFSVDEWLFWRMCGLGPMAGQAHHFRQYAPRKMPYAIDRYADEVNRLYGVMNKRLKGRDFLADRYSIADMACVGWVRPYARQGEDIDAFPHLKAWLDRVTARPAVQRGLVAGEERRHCCQPCQGQGCPEGSVRPACPRLNHPAAIPALAGDPAADSRKCPPISAA